MADNKRFVSYMYEYRNDEKLNNIGYARIEARSSQCKVFIHISLQGMEGKLLKAYMFYRKPAKHRFAYLGNILVKDGVGELKVKSDCNNVMNSDLALDDMCGVIVYQNSQSFAACEWDDEPITHQLIDTIENLDLAGGQPAVAATREDSVMEKAQDIYQDTPILVVDYHGQPVTEDMTELNEPPVTQTARVMQEAVPEVRIESAEISVTKEAVEERYQNKDYYKNQIQNPEHEYRNLNYDMLMHAESMESSACLEKEYPEIDCIEPTYGVCGQGIEQSETMSRMQVGEKRFECHPIAQNIFRRFPRIYPFEDNEICDCVRIEPQDIGLLPIDAWVLGNNSFLLHGYYTYRHLIFGKIKTPDGLVYVLGVPGIYQNRESFMARMFGFEYFKCAKLTEEKNGEFGYYYLPVQLG